MKKVIINADDFGYSTAVNSGIIKSFQEGVLSSTTLMANMPGCDEAIKLSKENPNLAIGGHLVLTCGKPMMDGKSLVDSSGQFYKLTPYHENHHKIDKDELFQEWCAQIDYLLEAGIPLTHLDSHHHVHTFEENSEVVKAIAEKYQITFRNAYGLEDRLVLPQQKNIQGFADLMNESNTRDLSQTYTALKPVILKELQGILEELDEEVSELMVHPAFVDETLYFGSSFNIQRIREVEVLTDPEVKQLFDDMNLEIVHYGNI